MHTSLSVHTNVRMLAYHGENKLQNINLEDKTAIQQKKGEAKVIVARPHKQIEADAES